MNRKEIERLKDSTEPFDGTRDDWYNLGCIDGLDAADAEPNLESIWHDINEKPEMHKMFLAQIGDDVF